MHNQNSRPTNFMFDWFNLQKDLLRPAAPKLLLRFLGGGLLIGLIGLLLFAPGSPPPATAQTGDVLFVPAWSSTESDETQSVAWGDYDGDGDLDLAVGNSINQPNRLNRLYRNDDGMLTTSAVWSSVEADNTYSVAWGDVDGDGDLDLAVGNWAQPNRLYRNDGGVLTASAVWSSAEADNTRSVVWGDYDSDGDLDLAVGNELQPNRLYHNDGGALTVSAVWSSGEADHTLSVAWGDADSDGDLDIVAGNCCGQPNRLYRNDDGVLTASAVWSSALSENTFSVAWGDYDGDLDLDLAVGNSGQPNRLYRNDSGTLTLDTSWLPPADSTTSVAWGDYDSDGDFDLAVGNAGQPNRLYRNCLIKQANDGCQPSETGLTTSAVWSSTLTDFTRSVAWGDYDSDGDFDLAMGNSNSQPNRLYRNDGGTLTPSAVWSSALSDFATSVAWGDYDSDGDFDLAVGNSNCKPNRLYRNEGGALTIGAVWSSSETGCTLSVAWGDVDGDGDLDLAVGKHFQSNLLYRNDSGVLTTGAVWSSVEADATYSVAWGDYDGDGDLDLAASGGPNRLYRNDDGTLTPSSVWSSVEAGATKSVAWGDVDGDGDLDLAVGNEGPSRLYRNLRRGSAPLVNDPSYVTVPRPGLTDDADFFSTPHIIQAANIPILYTLFDPEGDIVLRIFPEFSLTGGGQWFPATLGPGGDGLTNLAASPTGTAHTFVWNAETDLIKSDNVVFRIRAQPNYTHSPILWPAVDGKSPSFRVEAAPWYVKVVNQGGQAVGGATVAYAGQFLTTNGITPTLSDRAGLIRLNNPTPGQPLVALAQTQVQTTTRAAHDGWAFRTYLTSLNLDNAGAPHPDTIGPPGQQLVTVRPDNPLILFNLVVSVEWDATTEYLTMLEDTFRKASAYLYDVSDGQMAFGRVTIYDKAENWSDADFQFSTKNTVRPYAFVGGIISDDEAHTIRVGRFWDGGSGNSGDWKELNGYRTLVHEFGHYGLHLYDEYFLRLVDANNNFTGQVDAFCTDEGVVENDTDASNASMMFYQYNASELADKSHNWHTNCASTEQARLNQGESDWETVRRFYGLLRTPSLRGERMAGPANFPTHLLPFPEVVVNNSGVADSQARQLTVLTSQSQPVANALVALYTTVGGLTAAIDQGLTDRQGRIAIYGAVSGDTLRAATFDGALAGGLAVGNETSYQLTLANTAISGLAAQAGPTTPYLNLIPGTDGDTLTLRVHDALPGTLPLNAVVVPGEGAGSPQFAALVYSPSTEAYSGQVSFTGVGLGSGAIQIAGLAGGQVVNINSDYNLQQVQVTTTTTLYSEDGNFELHIPPNGIPAQNTFATVLPTGYVPAPLPAGKQVIGSAYEVRLSGAVTELDKEGLVRLHFHPAVMGVYTDTAIYYWEANQQVWQERGGEAGEVDNALAVPASRLGIYALMGTVFSGDNRIYLPVIMKQ